MPLERRFADTLKTLQARLRRLEARTAGVDSGFPLMALPTVIAATAAGPPATVTAFLNGSLTATGPYSYLASYTPTIGDNVIALPLVGTRTYVIIGAVV